MAALQRPFSFFSSTPKVEKAEPTTPPAVPAAAKVDPYGTMPLGMEGYCPVTLAEKGQWVEGRAQWGARHRGRTYLFAGESQQRAFLTEPDRYAPALSGDDPVVAFDGGKSVPGQRRYGVTYQSRIYLFSSPETRTTFSSNPQRYTARVVVAENPSSQTGTILR
jgi:YHS domain-containing protein